MKFSIAPAHGIKQYSVSIWDAVADRPLCTFIDGVYETEDETVIAKLTAMGYEPDDETKKVEIDEEAQAAAAEKAVRDRAKEIGINSWHNKSLDKLKQEIEAKEAE